MNDIFSESLDSEDGSSQTVEPAATPASDVVDPAAAQTGAASTDGDATAAAQEANPLDGIFGQQSTSAASGDAAQTGDQPAAEPAQDDVAKLEQDADTALSDERTPKWFKNVIEKVYKPKLSDYGSKVDAYSALGTPEELQERLSLIKSLEEVTLDPVTYQPVRSTKAFVDNLYQKDPQATYQLIADLATLPSPVTPGMTVSQELMKSLGIDPERLPEIQQFAQSGYALQASNYPAPEPEDLALLPDHLKNTFAQLDPATRESLMSDSDHVRNSNLEAHRIRLEHEAREKVTQEEKDAQAAQESERQQAEFKQAVENRAVQFFTGASEKVLQSFVQSLSTQAGLSQMDAMMITNTALNALEPTLAGRMSIEALKKEGIEIDPAIPGLIQQLDQKTKLAASYEYTGDKEGLQRVGADILALQETLAAKGNKMVASIALKRSQGAVQQAQGVSQQLANTQNNRHAIAGHAAAGVTGGGNSGGGQRMDFSDESYLEDLNSSGFGSRR